MLRRLWSNEPDSAARLFLYSSLVWLLVGMTLGLIMAIQLIYPDLFVSWPHLWREWTSFGRLRPAHVNVVTFGWLTAAYLGALSYIVPRLTGAPAYSERLMNAGAGLFNVFMLAGMISILAGYNQGREWAELPWAVDLAAVALLLTVAVNLFGSVLRRKERTLYVSLWYFMASLAWFTPVYVIGNKMWDRTGAYLGVNDAIVNWFFGHNVIGLWITTLGVGIAYYMIPIVAGRELYSHTLSMIGFWAIATAYPPIGAHHLIWGPVPYWLVSFALVFSVLMLIPVWTVLVNFYMTMKGSWPQVLASLPGKFLVLGGAYYFITCLQGPAQSLRSFSTVIHFTNWIPGHAHLAMLGAFSAFAFAFMYYAWPKLHGRREMWSRNLATWHFWLTMGGTLAMLIDLWFAGLIQGTQWNAGVPFVKVVTMMWPYNLVRALSGAAILLAQFLFVYNAWRTARGPLQPDLTRDAAPLPGGARP